MAQYQHRKVSDLSVFEFHQLRIARDTLRMSDVGAMVMGGMTKAEAREIIAKLGRRNNRLERGEG